MNVFVASWFFPPATSSEGIVTYKLLRNSRHDFDVFSSTSKQWGYNATMNLRGEENITVYHIETDDIQEWVEACVAKFEELYPRRQYTCVMTRSTPPESILVGQRIKERYPQVKWIASLADPISNNPYELRGYVDNCATLSNVEKTALKTALKSSDEALLKPWEKRPESGIQLLCKLKRWENTVLKQADMIISPSGRQLRYICDDKGWNPKFFAVPHSYDPSFYPPNREKISDKVIFSFIGYSDALRSLEPIVRAVLLLRQNSSPFLDKLEIRFIGNNPRAIQDMVLNYYLEDIIKCYPAVEYQKSLELMQESDWLIHVDAYFPEIQPGGSIFFAGKLADYMGAKRPILALTSEGSPAYELVMKAGGVCVESCDINGIADCIEQIMIGQKAPELNFSFIESYRADRVAARFDERLDVLAGKAWHMRCEDWPQVGISADEKLVTICVPSYNVQRYLERCLRSLVDHPYAPYIEVLVVDDGSSDYTGSIAKKFEEHYPGIVRLIQKPNGGHGSTINRAIQEGRGKYFMTVDGDDWIDSRQFSNLLSKVKTGEINSDVISSNYHIVNMETAACTPWRQQAQVEFFKEYTFSKLDVKNIYFTLASSIFKLNILKRILPLQEHTFYVDVEYILFPVPYLETATFVDYYIYKYVQGNTEQSIHIPTMVARYDHHDRVLRRVLDYGAKSQMSEAQHEYYDAILKQLLYTHFALCLVYDDNKERGIVRAQDFDSYLRNLSPELAKWIGKKMPELRIARACRYNVTWIQYSAQNRFFSFLRRIKPLLKQKIKNSRLLRKLINNRFTRAAVQGEFFNHGFGYRMKQKVKKVFSN